MVLIIVRILGRFVQQEVEYVGSGWIGDSVEVDKSQVMKGFRF